MKAEEIKNRDVCIMYVLQPLVPVPYTQGCAMENLQFDSKYPVAMNSPFLGTFPPSARFVIIPRVPAPMLFVKSDSGSICKFSRRPRLIEFFSLGIRPIYYVQDRYRSCHGDLSGHEEGYMLWQDHQTRAPKWLGFILTHNRHPQRSKGSFPFTCGNNDIIPRRTWSGRN